MIHYVDVGDVAYVTLQVTSTAQHLGADDILRQNNRRTFHCNACMDSITDSN